MTEDRSVGTWGWSPAEHSPAAVPDTLMEMASGKASAGTKAGRFTFKVLFGVPDVLPAHMQLVCTTRVRGAQED